MKDVHEEFIQTHSSIGMNKVPIKAKLAPPPRFTATPPHMPLFRQVLEEALRKVCSASCSLRGPSSAHSSKLLLQFEAKYATTDFVDGGDFDLFGNEVLVKTFWATVLSGNAQAGPVPFRMNFAWCHEVLEASGRLMLRLTRRPHCVTKHDLPFGDKVIVGALAHAGLTSQRSSCGRRMCLTMPSPMKCASRSTW